MTFTKFVVAEIGRNNKPEDIQNLLETLINHPERVQEWVRSNLDTWAMNYVWQTGQTIQIDSNSIDSIECIIDEIKKSFSKPTTT